MKPARWIAIFLIMCSAGISAQGDFLARARALHKQVPLIDGHNDFPWALRQNNAGRDLAKLDIRVPQPKLMTDIPRLRAGGVGGQFWSVYIPAMIQGPAAIVATIAALDPPR